MFDAASRLAEGRPAAGIVQDYVWACHLLGYQNPDLTLHASQVLDWYGSEDGIDLAALEADCEALRAAAAATEAALARQDAQLALLSVAWRGRGADASRDFLRRHGEASAAVVSAVRVAAESLASLRDRLWHSIDEKVAATVAAEARGARPDWRNAAQTVTTGAGDRATASELIDQEVKPFVDNDIRAQWLTAMQSAIAAVTDAYDAAVDELTSEVAIAFDVPGELGPSWSPPPSDSAATAAAGSAGAGGTAPVGAGWSTPPAAQPMSVPQPLPPTAPPPPPPPLLPPTAPPVEPAAMAPLMSSPSLGGGLPDVGSGLSGFGSQLGDMLGGLLGTSQDALSDLPEGDALDEGVLDKDDPDELDEDDEDEDRDDEDSADDQDVLDEDEEKEGETDDTEADPVADVVGEPEPAEPPAEPPPAEVLPSAPTEPPPLPPPLPPPPEPMSAAGTPCEIAANELPQVGE
jgi:hypothetical protein